MSTAASRRGLGRKGGGRLSLHARMLADLRGKILSGAWPPGHRIPVEAELGERYGCSRMTVSKVVGELVRAGLIERRRRAGSFVASPRSHPAILEIKDVRAEVEALGMPYGYRLIERRERRATADDRVRLGVPAGTMVLALHCLHLAGNRPFCREQRLINLKAVPLAGAERFEDSAPGSWLVAHVPWSEAEHRISATEADAATAEALAMAPGAACLTIARTTWRGGVPVTHVVLTYPGSASELVARFRPASR